MQRQRLVRGHHLFIERCSDPWVALGACIYWCLVILIIELSCGTYIASVSSCLGLCEIVGEVISGKAGKDDSAHASSWPGTPTLLA